MSTLKEKEIKELHEFLQQYVDGMISFAELLHHLIAFQLRYEES